MACHISPLKKAKKQGGNAITQPRSHPIAHFTAKFLDAFKHHDILALVRGSKQGRHTQDVGFRPVSSSLNEPWQPLRCGQNLRGPF